MGADMSRWTLARLLGGRDGSTTQEPSMPVEVNTPTEEILDLDFPAAVGRAFPEAFSFAWPAIQDVLAATRTADLSPLWRRSPALRGYDWTAYLQCSVVRMSRVLDGLWRTGGRSGRVLDFGAYFGNAALMCRAAGLEVDAIDAYREYQPAFDGCVSLMASRGVTVRDFADEGFQLSGMPREQYDAVLCLGVVEHIPHTPRLLLESIDRLLKPGGLLLLDTPNIAYLYNRQRLGRGHSIMPPIEAQYYTDVPFEGHHREYTLAEIQWMLEQLRHDVLSIDTFNYSLNTLGRLTGDNLANFRQMERDPSMREVIFAISRKPTGSA
jgi:SAM-dependent methyltransferase